MGVLLALVSGLSLGIFLRSVLGAPWPVAVFAFVIAALAGGAFLAYRRRAYGLTALFLVFVALGVGRTLAFESPLPAAFAAQLRHRVSYEGTVVGYPDLRDTNQRVPILVSRDTESVEVLAVAPRATAVAVGDRVFVSGTLEAPEPFVGDTGRLFRYDKYLEKSGIRFILNYAYIRVEGHAPWYALPTLLARIKGWFLAGLARALPEPQASLAGGIVIGGKSGLGSELQGAFTRSGLVQIVVLSGYNVMVVAEWILAALALTTLRRERAMALAALALLVFIGVAGFSATAVRAGLMALIALYAQATGKSYAAGRALALVMLLMLAWNPYYLAFDPSFDLSVAATAGLIWLTPTISSWLAAFRLRRVCQGERSETLSASEMPRATSFWQEAVATTLAAQIAVLPILLYEIGNLSLVAIPANVLAALMVPLAMGLSALAGLVGALIPPLAILAGTPAYLATASLVLIAETSAALPYAAFAIPAFPFALVVAAYAALIAVAASKRPSTTAQFTFAKKASRYLPFSAGR